MARDPEKYNYTTGETLGIELAIAKDGSHLITADGVTYSKSEVSILKETGGITNALHLVKKVFKPSELIGYNKQRPTVQHPANPKWAKK